MHELLEELTTEVNAALNTIRRACERVERLEAVCLDVERSQGKATSFFANVRPNENYTAAKLKHFAATELLDEARLRHTAATKALDEERSNL